MPLRLLHGSTSGHQCSRKVLLSDSDPQFPSSCLTQSPCLWPLTVMPMLFDAFIYRTSSTKQLTNKQIRSKQTTVSSVCSNSAFMSWLINIKALRCRLPWCWMTSEPFSALPNSKPHGWLWVQVPFRSEDGGPVEDSPLNGICNGSHSK